MVTCPRCEHTECVKAGMVKGRQRFRCKRCRYSHTVQERGAGKVKKKQALQLYVEGLGFRSIGRFLGVSHVSVYKWIRAFGEALEGLRSKAAIEVVEMDEMHSYIGSKKTTAGSGLLLIAMDTGSSTVFWDRGKRKPGRRAGKTSQTKKSER